MAAHETTAAGAAPGSRSGNGGTAVRQRLLGAGDGIIGLIARNSEPLGLALMSLAITAYAVATILAPLANWDLIAYTALIIRNADPTLAFSEVHSQAYNAIRDAVSQGAFLMLTEDRAYRITQYTDVNAFASMMPFYEMKWLYIAIAGAIAEWTGPVAAIRLMSLVSGIAIGGLIIGIMRRARALSMAPLVLAVLALSGYGEVMRLGSPDAFAAMLLISAILAYHARQDLLAALLIGLSILARPDGIVLCAVLPFAAWLSGNRLGPVLAIAATGLAAYLAATLPVNYPGWWVHLWLTQIEYVPTIEGFEPPFMFSAYCFALVKAALRAIVEEGWPAVLIGLSIGVPVMIRAGWLTLRGREATIMVTMLVTVAAKFVIFPVNEERFHFAYIIIAMMLAVLAWHRTARGH